MRKIGKVIIVLFFSLIINACQTQSEFDQLDVNQRKDYVLAMQVAEAAAQSGNPEAAEAALKEAHQRAPGASKSTIMLAELYIATHKYQEAASFIQEALPAFKNQPQVEAELLRQQGLAYWHLQQPNLAINSLLASYTNAKQKDLVFNDLGVLLDHLGQYQAAQNCYQQGLKLVPDNDVLTNNYVLSLLSTANIRQAEQLLDKPTLISSNNQKVIGNRTEIENILRNSKQKQLSSTEIAQIFRKKFGFDHPHAQITQENYSKISKICQRLLES